MNRPDWHPLRNIDRGRLLEARLQAHYAAQWLGRVGSAFVTPLPGYGHTSMSWDSALIGFLTHPLNGKTRLGLRIVDLTFVLSGMGTESVHFFPLNGRSDADVRKWLDEQLGAKGMEVGALDKTSPYEITPHAVAEGAAYNVCGISDALDQLAAWFANAHRLLGGIQQQMIGRSLSASPVRCWPHHFDLATLISLDESGSESARSVNAGLSPGDEYYDEPYFYVSPYPYPAAALLPHLSKLGHWHTRDFTAAIAPAGRIVETKDQRAEVASFLNDAIGGAIKVLAPH